jgi:hypothetical protein
MKLVQRLHIIKQLETLHYLLLICFVNGAVYCGSLAVRRNFRHKTSFIFHFQLIW